jgi:hypothetical protein
VLPTKDDAKAYLRLEHDDEDTVVLRLLAGAKADIENILGYALTAVARTHIDYDEGDTYGHVSQLALPGPFKTSSPAPVVTDRDGATVDAASYYLDDRGLRLLARPGFAFRHRPYSIVATVGLSAHPDYSSRLEAIASTAILELVAHRHLNRNPGMSSETDEGGGAIGMGGIGAQEPIPGRIMNLILSLPGASRSILA